MLWAYWAKEPLDMLLLFFDQDSLMELKNSCVWDLRMMLEPVLFTYLLNHAPIYVVLFIEEYFLVTLRKDHCLIYCHRYSYPYIDA